MNFLERLRKDAHRLSCQTATLLLVLLVAASDGGNVLSAQPPALQVVVYGGVPCGIAAAITAARQGVSVLLIEPTDHVGGLLTSGLNTTEDEHMLPWTTGGFADEFYRRIGKHYGRQGKSISTFESSVAEKVALEMLAEAKVRVQCGAAVDTVHKEGTRVTGITLTDGTQLAAKVFVDASYEGDLMARSGVTSVVGRESRSEFGEAAAGIRFDPVPCKARTVDADGKLLPGISGWAKDLKEGDAHPGPMSYNFRLTAAKEASLRVPFPPPAHYDAKRYAILADWIRGEASGPEPITLRDIIDFYPRRNGKFELNNKQAAVFSLSHLGGQFAWANAGYAERQRIFKDHLDYTLGLFHFLATDPSIPVALREETQLLGLHRGEFADNGHLPYQLYVREARRMRGAYVVTQNDVQKDRRKPDSIGMSSHFIDCHHVQRLAVSEHEYVNEGRIWRIGYAYQIPYRAITPRPNECTNLLVPGAASFTHVAFCTLRLESVWMITGHAAGVAAAMAAKQGIDVQKVDGPTLQKSLREQKQVIDFIPDQPQKCEHLNGPPEF